MSSMVELPVFGMLELFDSSRLSAENPPHSISVSDVRDRQAGQQSAGVLCILGFYQLLGRAVFPLARALSLCCDQRCNAT